MQQSGPIVYAYVAADGYVWADYIFGKSSRCSRVGQLCMHMWLLMAMSRLIVFWEVLLMP